ncbi:inner nuclear membrane protein enriched at telomere/subtelomere region [Microbotryomycetes sp. JL221]|nr:inner nuclear membrane protein enriched at telomere/subtelomere region [Microbotryomycetes sp. JL221]
MSNSVTPEHLLASFDPSKALVSQLRNILLSHDVPYTATAKKSELVALYEKHIRPRAPRLLAELAQVRASTQGILDGDSQNGSLAELDTTSESDARSAVSGNPDVRKRKTKKRYLAPPERPTKTPRRGHVAQEDNDIDDVVMGVDSTPLEALQDASGDNRHSSQEVGSRMPDRKPKRTLTRETIHATSEGSEQEPTRTTRKKRKSEAPSGLDDNDSHFSDYNPFQSGPEDTPERSKRRRKVCRISTSHAA